MAVDPRIAMMAQVAQGGGRGGGMPQGMPGMMPSSENGTSGGMPQGSSGGGLEMLMQKVAPLLQGMGPNAKMELGRAMQTPGVQQMIQQVMQNPQMMAQILQSAGGGSGAPGQDPRAAMASAQAGSPQAMAVRGGGMPNMVPGQDGPGPSTDGDLAQMDALSRQMRGSTPMPRKGPDYVGGADDEQEGNPQSAEQEQQMIQMLMNRAGT